MDEIKLAIKVDVDTDRGTRVGVANLLSLFDEFDVKATFLFSLGPDNTGRAIKRIFRPGFFQKAARTNVIGVYGWRTLINGVFWRGPHIGRRNEAIMRAARDRGHEVGIHCYDHVAWQDGLARMSRAEVFAEFDKAFREFERIFGHPARVAGAAGWQANRYSLAANDAAGLNYASDARGPYPFYPRIGSTVYKTLQIPTTLPTLDELLGRPEYPETELIDRYLQWLQPREWNVLTVHAEIEGSAKLTWFRHFLIELSGKQLKLLRLGDVAAEVLRTSRSAPVHDLTCAPIAGRAGTVAAQGTAV